MNYDIQFNNNGKKFQLKLLTAVSIKKSVENLVDTATIKLPEAVLNLPLAIEEKIGRGTMVTIKLGYDNKLITEFVGYINEITNSDSSLLINCEDALFLFRKSVENKMFKPASIKDIAQYLIDQIDSTFTLKCDFDFTYEKFIVANADAYDVLKKIVEETKANVYFNTELKELHIHAPFQEKGGTVKYRMDRNVQSSSLEYKRSVERKLEINIETTGADGKKRTAMAGVTGGEKITRTVSATTTEGLQLLADSELLQRSGDRYEGSIKTWLIPYVEPTYSADFADADYMDKAGRYYVKAVDINFSESGAERDVHFGIKLS